jgi:hypothetical protein
MERIPYRKTYELVGYVYDADLHCVLCATERFGEALTSRRLPEDSEGNTVYPLILEEVTEGDVCRDCLRRLNE